MAIEDSFGSWCLHSRPFWGFMLNASGVFHNILLSKWGKTKNLLGRFELGWSMEGNPSAISWRHVRRINTPKTATSSCSSHSNMSTNKNGLAFIGDINSQWCGEGVSQSARFQESKPTNVPISEHIGAHKIPQLEDDKKGFYCLANYGDYDPWWERWP
jgi:hypothetical protein